MMKEIDSPGRGAKRQKVNGERSIDGNGTEIDDLPESILVHILSFLPTKDAVRASVLGKRWKCLWKSVADLSFCENLFPTDEEQKIFMDSVDKVLSCRDSSNIRKFSLSCVVECEAPRINTWLSIALNHKVQVLKLRFSNPLLYALPPSLFTSESLTKLKVGMFEYLQLPSHISFPQLKKLTLKHVTFVDDHSTNQLFSGCHVLEKLTLDECDWENLHSVYISINTLKTLLIFESSEDENNCRVVINGKNLITFDYGGNLRNDYCLCDLSSLEDSSIVMGRMRDIVEEERESEVASRAHKLLRGLYNVRDLYLSYDTVKVLNYTAEFFINLPVYRNLTFLRVNLGSIHFNCGALQSLLKNSPSLTNLEFIRGISLDTSDEQDEWKLDPVPSCFLTQLKTIHIGDFTGTPAELHVVKALLQNAQVLERLCIKGGLSKNDNCDETLYLPLRSNGGELCFHL